MRAVSFFSGGISSFFATLRYLEQHDLDTDLSGPVVLLFTDTMTEDGDLYRFLEESVGFLSTRFDVKWERLGDGRDIWEVFRDRKMLGNTRADLCSRILKREPARKWIEENTSEDVDLIFGYNWDEVHRHERAKPHWAPRRVVSPLTTPPYRTRQEMMAQLADSGMEPPRLYKMGFSHNNCGGGCVKAGQGHFSHLLKVLPDVYADWEQNEEKLREQLGDVSILRDRQGGTTTPLTLKEFRQRQEAGQPCDLWDVGGCGCFEEEP